MATQDRPGDVPQPSLQQRAGNVTAALGPNTGAVVGFLLIVIAGSLLSDVFLTWTNIRNIFLQSAMLGVVALGMTFVILTGGIDLSVGSVLSLCSVLAAMMYNNGQGYPLPVVLLATLGVGAVIGAINGGIIVWRQVAPFIVTLAMMGIALGAALTVADGKPIGGISGAYAWLGAGRVFSQIPVPVVIMVATYLIGAIILRYTPYGRSVYAIGGNEQASRLSGISVNRVKVITYTISGLCAALGAIIFSARVTVGDPWAGRGLELDAIAAVVIGGTSLFGGYGSVWGTFLGTLIITIVNNLLNLMNVSPYSQGIAKGLIILIAIALYRRRAE
ncbi:MAG: ABC transporter permease [Thermomicrobiales bacterium]|nr:ABC transporter permease [Thermomicrobiales bacterium]